MSLTSMIVSSCKQLKGSLLCTLMWSSKVDRHEDLGFGGVILEGVVFHEGDDVFTFGPKIQGFPRVVAGQVEVGCIVNHHVGLLHEGSSNQNWSVTFNDIAENLLLLAANERRQHAAQVCHFSMAIAISKTLLTLEDLDIDLHVDPLVAHVLDVVADSLARTQN